MLEISAKLPRKRAFVTGAASGLGAAICELLARDRWTIGMCDSREEALSAQGKRVEQLGGVGIEYCFDVKDRKAFKKAADKFVHDQDGIDLLVNNAGVAGGGVFGEFQLRDWDLIMDVNVLGVVNGCHYFTPYFKDKRYGHILNVSSAAAFAPVPRLAAYCTAGAAVKAFSEVLYNELFDYNVGVSVFMPSFFRTQLHERTRGDAADQGKYLVENAEHGAEEVAMTALAGVAAHQLHIYFPSKSRMHALMYRLAPQKFIDMVRQASEKRFREVQHLRGARPLPEDGSA